MKCSKCSLELKDDDNFCFNCGEKVIREKICQKCTNVLVADSKFCSHCGLLVIKTSKGENYLNQNIDHEENEILLYYRKCFAYIGSFSGGFAPVIDQIENPKYVGYVSMDINIELLKKNLFSRENTKEILEKFEVNLNILAKKNKDDKINWVGEFINDRAFLASERKMYSIYRDGQIEDFGDIVNDEIKSSLSFIVRKNKKNSINQNHCIISYKGNILRDNNEYIAQIIGKYAKYSYVGKSEVGLMNIKSGKTLTKQIYNDINYHYDYQKENYIIGARDLILIPQIYKNNTYYFGCINPKKGFIFNMNLLSVEAITNKDDYWVDKKIIITTGISENSETFNQVFFKKVSDIEGNILLEYQSSTEYSFNDYIILNNAIYIVSKKYEDIEIIKLSDCSVIAKIQDCKKVISLNDDYIIVENNINQFAVLSLGGGYSIPFGRYDDILNNYSAEVNAVKVQENGLWGFADYDGEILIPTMYKSIRDFYNYEEEPRIYVISPENISFYVNYKNLTDGDIPASDYIKQNE